MMTQCRCDMRERLRFESIFFFKLVDSVAHVVRQVGGAPAMCTAEAIKQCYGIVVNPVSCQHKKEKLNRGNQQSRKRLTQGRKVIISQGEKCKLSLFPGSESSIHRYSSLDGILVHQRLADSYNNTTTICNCGDSPIYMGKDSVSTTR